MFIASTAMVEGPGNPLVDAAMQIGEDPDAKEKTAASKPEPATGTYERFMGSFGSPQRWGGR